LKLMTRLKGVIARSSRDQAIEPCPYPRIASLALAMTMIPD
jgi:hypothetical protein